VPGRMGRYMELQGLEEDYLAKDLGDRGTRDQARREIQALIELYRSR
jgi:hypothetical protein